MVKALLAGTKTQTRRIVKTREPIGFHGGRGMEGDLSCWGWFFDGPEHHGYMVLARGLDERHDHGHISIPCPYGVPGDRLWVRETYAIGSVWDATRAAEVPALRDDHPTVWLRADDGEESWANRGRWRPSIFMPRWASRLSLLVTSTRVERLQDISEADARAEGVESIGATCDYRGAYCALWESINGAESWAANPWVFVVGFEVLDAKGGAT